MMEQADEILSATAPPIKMIFVTCGNPLTQVPDTSKVEKAFASVDTVVVIDQYMTDTAKVADYVLPTTTSFEVEDVYYASMYHGYVNYGMKLVDAPGEAKSDLWIWSRLAERLGFGEVFKYTREQLLEIGLAPILEKGVSLFELKREGNVRLPAVKDVPWADRVFKTQSGKYEFTSSEAETKGLSGKIALSFPRESIINNRELGVKYPYSLLSLHPLRSNHSQHYHLIPGLQQNKIEISTDVAVEKGLKENDHAKVFNDRGEIKGIVKILKKAHPNTINVDEGNWSAFGGSINRLTSSGTSDNGLGSTLYDCLVNIVKC
jgi:anaerobic selenocysteine-containing dehydrogenase